jgi:hypothetical protein
VSRSTSKPKSQQSSDADESDKDGHEELQLKMQSYISRKINFKDDSESGTQLY